jgi:uncharacterized protein involved in response to NO
MLHIAYSFIPLGLFVLGIGAQTAGLHLLGIGAIGGMTTAVMMRATLGHTGRTLKASPSLVVAFLLIVLAALTRSAAPYVEIATLSGIEIAAIIWTVGYGMILLHVGPWLCSASIKPRTPNKLP